MPKRGEMYSFEATTWIQIFYRGKGNSCSNNDKNNTVVILIIIIAGVIMVVVRVIELV